MKRYPTLYSKDTSGNLRTWWMEQEGYAMRSVACNHLGTETRSGWKYAVAKNVGRSNATTAEEQAEAEIHSIYKKKVEIGGYAYDPKDVGKSHFEPMLAATWSADDLLPKGKKPAKIKIEGGYTQPKLDGVRCIMDAEGAWSRNGKPLLGAMLIWEKMKDIFGIYPDAKFDGEIYNHDFKAEFEQIVSLVKKEPKTEQQRHLVLGYSQYHIYDMPVRNESDDERTFSQRLADIKDFFDRGLLEEPTFHMVETVYVNTLDLVDAYYSKWMEEGYEGMMFRHDVPYVHGRSHALVKRKEFMDDEFEVVRVEEGVGNWAGHAKRIVCKLPDGRTFEAGMRGNMAFAKRLLAEANEYVGGTATIRFQNYTADGIPRFGVMTQIYKRGEERL